MNNTLKHARAGKIDVALRIDTKQVALEVSDDGAGFDPADPQVRSKRLGLTSMDERAQTLGGSLSIDSRPGAGTKVSLEVPVGR